MQEEKIGQVYLVNYIDKTKGFQKRLYEDLGEHILVRLRPGCICRYHYLSCYTPTSLDEAHGFKGILHGTKTWE